MCGEEPENKAMQTCAQVCMVCVSCVHVCVARVCVHACTCDDCLRQVPVQVGLSCRQF